MLIVVAFSVVIYLWAMRTKLPRDEMLLLVNKQAGESGTSARPPITELARNRERPRRPAGPFSCAGAYTRPVRE